MGNTLFHAESTFFHLISASRSSQFSLQSCRRQSRRRQRQDSLRLRRRQPLPDGSFLNQSEPGRRGTQRLQFTTRRQRTLKGRLAEPRLQESQQQGSCGAAGAMIGPSSSSCSAPATPWASRCWWWVRCGAEPTPVEAGRCRADAGRNQHHSALLGHLAVRGAPERPGAWADGVPDGRRRPKAGVSSVPDVLTDCPRDPEQLVGAVPVDGRADSAAAHAGGQAEHFEQLKVYVCIGCSRIIRTCIFPQLSVLRWNHWRWDTKIFWNTHQKAKLNATHLPSPLKTPFSHYFRLALKICFSLCAQVPNRQLLTRGAFPDSTIERLTSYLLKGLRMKCETSWISVALKFSSSWSGQRRKVVSSASPEDTENHARSLTPRRL